MTSPPPPRDLAAPVPALVQELAGHLGRAATVARCVALLAGAEREDHLDVLPYLTGFSFADRAPTRDRSTWKDHWVRTWGARGLLHVWDDDAAPAVVTGLRDPAWRPAEMCLKVAARWEVGGAGDGAAALAAHRLPRVRGQALRALAVVGDTEHLDVVRARLDDPDDEVRRRAATVLERLATRLDIRPERG